MKKYILIIALIIIICLTGCTKNQTYQAPERPHLYWQDIDVVVTDVNRRQWFAKTTWYLVEYTVTSEEYGLTQTFYAQDCGLWRPQEWDYEEGQILTAELYSWVMDSTGEVVRREINQVY